MFTVSQKPDANEAASQQAESSNHTSSLPPRVTHSTLHSHLPIPEQFQKPSDPRTMAGSSQPSSSLPSLSESSNALNGNATSPPSTLTGCTSVTSIPSNENLSHNKSYVRFRRSRDHIYIRQVSGKIMPAELRILLCTRVTAQSQGKRGSKKGSRTDGE